MTLILSGTNGVSDIDGDASTPALRGTDANSGVFFGSDVVGVSTGGSEKVSVGASALVINDGGADFDFRVEGDTNANLLFVDASADSVGIGTNTPSAKLDVVGVIRNDGSNINLIKTGTTGTTAINFGDASSGDVGSILYDHDNDLMRFGTNDSVRMRIYPSGNITIGSIPAVNRIYGSSGNPLYGLIDKVVIIGDSTDTVNYRVGIAFNVAGRIGSGIFANNVNAGSDEDTNLEFYTTKEGLVNSRLAMTITEDRDVSIVGALSKGSGSFKIDHPLESKADTHHLVHSFVEGPQADNIYRGKVDLVAGSAMVNIDTVAGMTEGTFVALNREVQCFTSNESGWTAVRGSVSGNILTIEAQDNTCTDTISWLVIGERQDQHMYDTNWTDENGKVIVEPLKPIAEEVTEQDEETVSENDTETDEGQ